MAPCTAPATTTAASVRTRPGGMGGERTDGARWGTDGSGLKLRAPRTAPSSVLSGPVEEGGSQGRGTGGTRRCGLQPCCIRAPGTLRRSGGGGGASRCGLSFPHSTLPLSPRVRGYRSETWTLCFRWKQVKLGEG